MQEENQTGISVPEENPKDRISALDRIFESQKRAFARNPMPSAEERIENLKKLKQALVKYRDDIAAAIDGDFSCRSRDESRLAELIPTIEAIHYTIKRIKKWMKPSRRKVGILFQPARARVIYQPLGVVGIITSWNYPVYLSLGPLIGVLAAGNRAMIKMSKFTPRTAEVLKKMLYEIFDEDTVALLSGESGLGEAFSKKPWDHLIFTGSTAVGRHVMRAAADNLTPVTLELGGKSPAIVGAEFPVKDAAERIAFGKVFNVGQTCVAPDYVLCARHKVTEFVDAFQKCVAGMYPSMKENPQYTSIINEQEHARLKEILADAEEKGAKVIEVNRPGENFSGTRKMPIHLLLEVRDEMRVMQDEIFGPLLPILPYDSLKDAAAYINDHPKPLALYYFEYDQTNIDYILTHTHSGGAVINETMVHVAVDDMPFGGVGSSGMGEYHGHEGFLTFSKAKGVLFKPRLNSGKLIYPPYGTMVHKLLYRLFIR
ncbi:MAG: coniferyl aldehyde dehydrogenase [Desulfobacterales bacterium]